MQNGRRITPAAVQTRPFTCGGVGF